MRGAQAVAPREPAQGVLGGGGQGRGALVRAERATRWRAWERAAGGWERAARG